MVKRVITDMTPKSVRMSVVALTAAVLAVVWAIVDQVFDGTVNAVIVSAVTALVMLIAQFYDHRAVVSGHEVFEGDGNE
jgi:hypothetical protein